MFLLTKSTHRMVVRYHPQIGHLFVPGLCARIPTVLGGHYAVTNSLGFRSDVEFEPKRGDRPRILFFGDSITAGDGVDNAQRFAELTGEALGAEVYNYAVSGTATDQQLLVLEHFAGGVEADLVVLCVYVENIERIKVAFRESIDRSTQRRVLVPKPYFTLESGALALHHVPVPVERPRAEERSGAEFQKNEPISNPIRDHIIKPLDKHLGPSTLKAARAAVREHLPWLLPAVVRHSGFQPHKDYESAHTKGFRLMEAILRRFAASSAPTPLLIVPLPTPYFFRDALEPIYQRLFERLGDKSRVFVADMTTPLVSLPRAEKKQLTFGDDPHYTPQGHARVAKAMAEAIRKTPAWQQIERLRGAPAAAPARARAAEVAARPTYVLGLSCFDRGSAAALVKDGQVTAAAEEEWFSRLDGDRGFPRFAINYCLEQAGIHARDLSAIIVRDDSASVLEARLRALASAGGGRRARGAWDRCIPSWLHDELGLPQLVRRYLAFEGPLLRSSSLHAQAAAGFYASPFDRAAVLTFDGAGDTATASIGVGSSEGVEILATTRLPDALGRFASAMAELCGFTGAAGVLALIDLAPLGQPRYAERILRELVTMHEDGTIELQAGAFSWLPGEAMTTPEVAELLGGPARKPGAPITAREQDLACSVRAVVGEALVRAARFAHARTGEEKLVLTGAVAQLGAADGRLASEGPFEEIWIHPVSGDAAAAMGAALAAHHVYLENPRARPSAPQPSGARFGPGYSEAEIAAFVETHDLPHRTLEISALAGEVAKALAEGKVVGVFTGRMEVGPRAPGGRVILAGVRDEPAARTGLFAAGARDELPELFEIVSAFEAHAGGKGLAAAPFAAPGEPVVCSPDDAYRCFMISKMDVLALGNRLLVKADQPPWPAEEGGGQLSDDASTGDAQALGAVFQSDFLPAASALLGGAPAEGAGATWREAREKRLGKDTLPIPRVLDAPTLDPRLAAAAITASCEPGPGTAALGRLIARLIEVGML
uniref:Carbamoyltransferase n=1 Tax=Phaselicystis flava TaxID=525924 RepID=A0A3S7V062_9BACT|nr:carbamoyltransferase [Phaselicystis flava]